MRLNKIVVCFAVLLLIAVRLLFLPTISTALGFVYTILIFPSLLFFLLMFADKNGKNCTLTLWVGLLALLVGEILSGYGYFLGTGIWFLNDKETGAVNLFSVILQASVFVALRVVWKLFRRQPGA